MPDTSTPANTIPLANVLEQVSDEIKAISSKIHLVEDSIANLVSSMSVSDKRILHGLQIIDSMSQSLIAISRFAKDISGEVSKDWSIDTRKAAGNILLADLAARLGFEGDGLPHAPPSDIEEWEVFP